MGISHGVKMRKMRQCSLYAGRSLCAIIDRGRTELGGVSWKRGVARSSSLVSAF
jgi:hypothetical protein